MDLVRRLQLRGDVPHAGRGGERREHVLVLWMPLETLPFGIRAGQRTSIGTRTPPSQVVAFSPRNGVVPPSGHQDTIAPLSVV
jgi:hypothetical protein